MRRRRNTRSAGFTLGALLFTILFFAAILGVMAARSAFLGKWGSSHRPVYLLLYECCSLFMGYSWLLTGPAVIFIILLVRNADRCEGRRRLWLFPAILLVIALVLPLEPMRVYTLDGHYQSAALIMLHTIQDIGAEPVTLRFAPALEVEGQVQGDGMQDQKSSVHTREDEAQEQGSSMQEQGSGWQAQTAATCTYLGVHKDRVLSLARHGPLYHYYSYYWYLEGDVLQKLPILQDEMDFWESDGIEGPDGFGMPARSITAMTVLPHTRFAVEITTASE